MQGLRLMTPKERRHALLVVVSIAVNAAFQTAVLVSVVPFVQILLEPAKAEQAFWAHWAEFLLPSSYQNRLLVMVGLLLLIAVSLKNLFAWFQIRWQDEFSARCENRLGAEIFEKVLAAPYAWSLSKNSSIITEIILGHVTQWSRSFIRSIIQLVNDAFFAVLAIGVLIWSSPKAGLIVLVFAVILAAGLFRLVRPIILTKTEEKRIALMHANLVCIQGVSGVKDLKMSGSKDQFVKDFTRSFRRYSYADAYLHRWKVLPRLGIEFIGYGALVTVGLLAVFSGQTGTEAAALLTLYSVVTLRMIPVFSTLVTNLGNVIDSFSLIKEIHETVGEISTPESDHRTTATVFENWKRIQITDLHYRYPQSSKPAMKGVSLTIERGQSYGIVGLSGAGKSTFIDLLAGLIEPSTGSIQVDQTRLDRSNFLNWRDRIGYVSQHPFILDGTLRENITFGAAACNVDELRLQKAIHAAQLETTAAQFLSGLDTPLGERGVRLSGGQRQRVAIARALYRSVDLLIMDEATSSLDSLTEIEISRELSSLVGQVTIVLVAHRFSTVRGCDRIFVFSDGALVDSGSHDALLISSPLYQKLDAAQFKQNRYSGDF
jgi:ABC-type multidrug transport system fused ATPase/permease subunit